MITREQQIKLALAIIKPGDREQCRASIIQIIEIVDNVTEEEVAEAALVSKSTKAKVTVIRNALYRARSLPDPVREKLFKDVDLQRHLANCEAMLKQPTKRLVNTAIKQRLAAAGAQALLFDYGIKPAVTGRKVWDKLAAVLYGDPDANMFRYIRELKDID